MMMNTGIKENNHKISSPMPTRRLHSPGNSSYINIPLDLTMEILKKLPIKSLLRFQCVSKQWSSIITSCRHFLDSNVTRSSTQPPTRDIRIIFHHYQDHPKQDFFIFSSTYPKNTDKKSVSTTANAYEHVRGLICCWSGCSYSLAIYNPTTRQNIELPEPDVYMGKCFFGYDPLNNQYKILRIPIYSKKEKPCQVFTLGDQKWRNIQGIGIHIPIFHAVCINGVMYYRGTKDDRQSGNYFLVSFDVSSEKFSRVQAPKTFIDHKCTLMNYKGQLGLICCQKGVEIWVMEDCGKQQEWSKIIFYDMEGFEDCYVVGATHGGEIVFANRLVSSKHQFAVFYYDPNRNSLRYVVLEGLEDVARRLKHSFQIWAVPDYVENTMRL